MFGIIYKITSQIDGKSYIGQTKFTLEKRWRDHCSKHSECTYLSNSIKKNGKENFTTKILVRCNSIEEMNYRESYYIKLFNTLAPNGYNLKSGGANQFYSEETKHRISESLMGDKNPFFGRKHTEETKKKISKSNKYKKYFLGKKHSEETKRKIGGAHSGKIESLETKAKKSLSHIGDKNHMFNKKHSEETKRKISQSMKNRFLKENEENKQCLYD